LEVPVKHDEYHQQRVHLPVCPECLRVMKGYDDGEWKCCGVFYKTTHDALRAYGLERDHPDVRPSEQDFIRRLLTGDCQALYGKGRKEWIDYTLEWVAKTITDGDEIRAAQICGHELEIVLGPPPEDQ
jgi:hypothetical protein